MSGTTSGTTATHDPLCMIPKVGGFFRMGGAIFPPVVDGDCAMCDLIAMVREDERRTLDEAEQAVAKIWENHPNSDWDEFMKEIQMAFDAIRLLKGKP